MNSIHLNLWAPAARLLQGLLSCSRYLPDKV